MPRYVIIGPKAVMPSGGIAMPNRAGRSSKFTGNDVLKGLRYAVKQLHIRPQDQATLLSQILFITTTYLGEFRDLRDKCHSNQPWLWNSSDRKKYDDRPMARLIFPDGVHIL